MTSNFEFALSHVDAGFAISLGDDDGLMPNAVRMAADIITQEKVDAITSNSIYYAWPSFPIESMRDKMILRDIYKNSVEIRNAKSEIIRLVSYQGSERNYVWGMPGLYRGFVHTDVIKKAKGTARYFRSVTPDAYSAFVNSFFLKDFAYSYYPFTIEGVSGRSNGASQIIGLNSSEEKKYVSENDIEFNPDLSYAPSPMIILAEAYLQARANFPEHCADHDFSLARVCRAAMREAAGPNKSRVEEAVREIIAKNGIVPLRKYTLGDAFEIAFGKLSRILNSMEVDCRAFEVKDVHSASLLAHFIVNNNHRGATASGWKLMAKKVSRKLLHSTRPTRDLG